MSLQGHHPRTHKGNSLWVIFGKVIAAHEVPVDRSIHFYISGLLEGDGDGHLTIPAE